MISVLDSDVTASMRNRGSGEGIGRYREGFGSRVGGSSSSGKVADACLLTGFIFCCGWYDGKSYEFFSA
jgi:hypothetical protein